jgi:hypothetical protein
MIHYQIMSVNATNPLISSQPSRSTVCLSKQDERCPSRWFIRWNWRLVCEEAATAETHTFKPVDLFLQLLHRLLSELCPGLGLRQTNEVQWIVLPCRPVVHTRLGGTLSLSARSTSKPKHTADGFNTSVNTYLTVRRDITESITFNNLTKTSILENCSVMFLNAMWTSIHLLSPTKSKAIAITGLGGL